MEQQTAKHATISSEHEQSDATLYLVSRLLLETLPVHDEIVVVKSESGNFLHDPEMRIESSGPIRVLITDAELAESGIKTEISVSGVVDSQDTIQCSYTLYFLMKREVAVIPKKTTHLENVIGRSLVFHFKDSSESLHDSLFDLSLIRINAQGEDYNLGKGRGFLFFGMNEPIIDKFVKS